MVKTIRSLCCVVSLVVFIVSLTLCCTYCFTSINQASIGLASGESNIDVSVELNKYDKNTNKAISGTLFYLFKENGEQIGSKYVTDEDGKINVLLKKGKYYFQEITPSLGYTFDKKDNENITKYYFEVEGKKDEQVVIDVYNIRLNGSLLVSKVLENADGSNLSEEQLNKDFTFNITFSDDKEYSYKINDGEELTIKSGDTLKLKHGDTAVFNNIPMGVLYNITEEEIEDYLSNSSNSQGTITEETSNVVFTNIYNPEFKPSEENIKLLITKKLEGEYLSTDENKEFNFTLIIDNEETKFNLKKDETKEFDISIGSKYEVKEDNYYSSGYKQEITNSSGIAYKDDINVVATNTYIGEVKKIIAGEKTWILNNQNITLPKTITVNIKNNDIVVDTKDVKPNSNGKWLYEFIVPKYDKNKNEIKYTIEENMVDGFIPTYNEYNITNTYVSPISVKIPTVYKDIYGNDYPNAKFEFALTGKGMPMPEGSQNGIKVISITNVGEGEFGSVTFKNPGVYTYTISELNTGIKGFIYDERTYNIVITITEENNVLSASIDWEGRSKDNPGILFTNTYDETVLGTNIVIAGTINFEHGNNKKDNYPKSVILEIYGNNELVMQKQISNKDNWKYMLEVPKYDSNGNKVVYTIKQNEIENYETKAVGYDVYNKYIGTGTPTPNNPQTGDNIKNYFITLILSGLSLLILLLGFRKKKITICGTIMWENDIEQLSSVTISVYADDELVEQKQISKDEDWYFEFKLPKYNEYKEEINYVVEQNKLLNYETGKTKYIIKYKYSKKIRKIKYKFYNKNTKIVFKKRK